MTVAPGQIVVIGDSHIGLGAGSERAVVEWIDRLAALRPKALYLDGDVFHYLIAHPKFRTPAVDTILGRLHELVRSGVPVHYVEGNRDFFLHGSFVEEAVTDVALEYSVRAGSTAYLIVHGDMINDRDWPYRFWRKASKNRVSRFSLELIPRRGARWFVDRVEKRLARSNFKHKSQLPTELMKTYGEKRGADGFTHVVFGHFHRKLVMPTEGATVIILPPWYDSGEAMIINPESGEFSFAEI